VAEPTRRAGGLPVEDVHPTDGLRRAAAPGQAVQVARSIVVKDAQRPG
jgi:hypothetical protein